MKERPRHKETQEIGEFQEITLKLSIEQSKMNKSEPFTMSELVKVLNI